MNILFLCHRVPYPPKRGGKIRPFNMIRHLARSHEVAVATLVRSAQEESDAEQLRSYCDELYVGRISPFEAWARFGLYGLMGRPATFGYFHSPALYQKVRRLLAVRKFDAILVHCSSMGHYVAHHEGCRKVMDFGDALNLALREEMRRDGRVFCIGEDIVLGVPFGVTKGLIDEFGAERVLNAPISEAAIVGSAMGAAMTGLVPVVDMHFADFVTCAMDEVANQIAKSRYMFGGQVDCPLVLRMPYGIGRSGGGHHSNSVEAWFVNIPGLKICIPSTPADARGLLKTAVRDPDPVLLFEHRGLYRVTGEVPEAETLIPLGMADVKRPGRDVTVIATARMVHESLEAARRLAEDGVEVEVVDPRSLVPLDRETLAASVRRTNHVVIAEEGPMRGSTGAWLAWVIMEECFDDLDAPIARVAGPNVPIPFSPPLEAFATPKADDVVAAVRQVLK